MKLPISMKLPIRLLFAAALLGLLPTSASAQPYGGYYLEKARVACGYDLDRFCPHVAAGGGRLIRCLRRNEHRLNPVCYKAVQVVRAVHVCRVDAYRLCSHVAPGEGRIIRCLDRNQPKLNPSCAAQFAKATAPY